MDDWLLLLYKVPTEPSARRVAVWRKLKRLGAVLLHDAVWVLPATDRTREQFQWLAAEILEADGEAMVWEATLAQSGQADALVRAFLAQVEPTYQAILNELMHDEADLAALSRRYQQTLAGDHFQSPLGKQARAALMAARSEMEGETG